MIQQRSRKEKYQTINGCTKQYECQQLFWGLSTVALITLYSIFTVPPIIQWQNAPLIVFMAIVYFFCLLLIIDYIILTVTDPVDQRIKGLEVEGETKFCSKCDMQVGIKTYHCLKCMRCTDRLDHHSMLVNNCISLNNISNFLRMNVSFAVALGGIAVQSIVVFAYSYLDSELYDYILNRWIILAVGVGAFAGFPVATFTFFYSCYIYSKDMPKIEYLYNEKASHHSDIESTEKIESVDSNNNNQSEKRNMPDGRL